MDNFPNWVEGEAVLPFYYLCDRRELCTGKATDILEEELEKIDGRLMA